MDYLEFIPGTTSHIPDKAQVTALYWGFYANAHRGKAWAFSFSDSGGGVPAHSHKGWAEMICKVYEVDPLFCLQCGAQMKVMSCLPDYAVVDRIINHLKLTFVAKSPPLRFSSPISKF